MTSAPQLRTVLLVAALGLLLGACTAPAPTPAPSATETRDRVTASDEPEAQKRARARMELASAYYSRGQMTTALDQVKLAIAADPLYGEAFNLRGLIYSNLGEKTLAEESFKRALQLNARDADTMHNYAWYLCQQQRYGESNAMFNQALAGVGVRARSDQPVRGNQPVRGALSARRLRACALLRAPCQLAARGLQRTDVVARGAD